MSESKIDEKTILTRDHSSTTVDPAVRQITVRGLDGLEWLYRLVSGELLAGRTVRLDAPVVFEPTTWKSETAGYTLTSTGTVITATALG